MISNQKKLLLLIEIEIFLNHNENLLVCLSVILSSEVLTISLLCCSQLVVGSHTREGPETQARPILESYSSSHIDWPKAGHVTQACSPRTFIATNGERGLPALVLLS